MNCKLGTHSGHRRAAFAGCVKKLVQSIKQYPLIIILLEFIVRSSRVNRESLPVIKGLVIK